MTIETAYFIAQIIAAGAIIGTLVYGIIQIRDTNRLARNQLSYSAMVSISEFNRAIGLDKASSRIWRKGHSGDDDLNEDERTQFNLLMMSAFSGFEAQLLLSEDGLINPAVVDRSHRQIRYMMSRQGARKWWPKNRDNFTSEFRKTVDSIFNEARAADIQIDDDDA